MVQPSNKRLVTEAAQEVKLNAIKAGKLYVTSFGTLGTANDTSVFQAAVDAASVLGANVIVPPGEYKVEGLVIPSAVIVEGSGEATSRFTVSIAPQGRKASVVLARVGTFAPNNLSTATMVTVTGAGCGLRNITLDGRGAPGTILVTNGFEDTLDTVRVINGGGIGIDVQKANNTRWQYVIVDDCGGVALDKPAMKIWSKDGAGAGGNETNTLDIYGLTIERSENVSLEIAIGNNTEETWAEWVRIFDLHLEASYLDSPNIVSPAIRIGNVRSLTFVDPFIYAGNANTNAVIIRHEEQATRAYGRGGVRFLGGTILGPDNVGGGPENIMPIAVDLVTGNDIAFIGTRFLRYSAAAVKVRATYGSDVHLDPSTVRSSRVGSLPVVSDDRTTKSLIPLAGDIEIQGHLTQKNVSTGSPVSNPTAAGQNGATGTSLQNATDARGKVLWGTGAAPAAGMQQIITFAKPYAVEPVVTLTPGNAATAALGLYVAATVNDIRIYASNVPAVSQAATTYQVAYHVIG